MAPKTAPLHRSIDLPAQLQHQWPATVWQDVTVIVGVSGGPDSVALLRALVALRPACARGSLIVAHFNHRWRGHESDADAEFVESLSQQLGLVCVAGQASQAAAGSEAAARRDRHQFLLDQAMSLGARYVLTAHTADDQAETVLHRLLRGTGPAGLVGIPRVRRLNRFTSLIRPLLSTRRAELLDYLTAIGQAYRLDETNRDVRRTRNRIRHELIPHLAARYNKHVADALIRLAELQAESQSVIDQLVADLAHRHTSCRTNAERVRIVELDCDGLAAASAFLVRQLLIALWKESRWPLGAMTQRHWLMLGRMMTAPQAPALTLPGKIDARRDGPRLVLRMEDEG